MRFGLIAFAVYYLYQKDEAPLETEENVVAEEKIEEINSMRLGMTKPDNLNPILSKNQNVQDISKLIFEPLVQITEDFKAEYILADEISRTSDTSYLIKIRDDIKWHNGSSLVPSDVKFTIEKIQELGNESIYYSNVSNIESVKLVGKTYLRIDLYEKQPLFEYSLNFPIICESFFGEDDLHDTERNNIPMGTGMYKIKNVDMSLQIELKINEDWWNIGKVKPKLERIDIKIYSSASEVYNAYKLDSIDFLNTTRNTNVEKNIGTLGYNTKESIGREFNYLVLNCTSEALSNKEVRQAISYAINREEIVNNAFGNKFIQADYPLEYGSYLYNKNTYVYEYNTDKAKEILENNGWNFSYKRWQKNIDGIRVIAKVDILVNSENEVRVKAADIIKNNLEALGIQVNVISAKGNTYDYYLSNKYYDILITGINLGVSPSLERFFKEGNLANYESAETNTILNEIYTIEDDNILKQRYESLQKIYQDDRAYIGLCFNKITVIYSKNLAGTINPTWYNTFNNIDSWYRKK